MGKRLMGHDMQQWKHLSKALMKYIEKEKKLNYLSTDSFHFRVEMVSVRDWENEKREQIFVYQGSLYVWASGDGGENDDCNCDGYAASMWTISINSAINDGRTALYDESCSSTLASTFSNGRSNDPEAGLNWVSSSFLFVFICVFRCCNNGFIWTMYFETFRNISRCAWSCRRICTCSWSKVRISFFSLL